MADVQLTAHQVIVWRRYPSTWRGCGYDWKPASDRPVNGRGNTDMGEEDVGHTAFLHSFLESMQMNTKQKRDWKKLPWFNPSRSLASDVGGQSPRLQMGLALGLRSDVAPSLPVRGLRGGLLPLGRRAVVAAPRRRHEDPSAPLGRGWGQGGDRIPQVGVGIPCSVPGVYYRV